MHFDKLNDFARLMSTFLRKSISIIYVTKKYNNSRQKAKKGVISSKRDKRRYNANKSFILPFGMAL